jgi:hypothetical protein
VSIHRQGKMKKTVDFGTLKITIDIHGEVALYKFDGIIDENFKEADIPRAPGKAVIFDLENIESINSIGIREWIKLANGYSDSKTLSYKNCSVPFVDQMNMVPDSIGTATIQSFCAPYYRECNICTGEKSCLVDAITSHEQLLNAIPPEQTCNKCNEELEFDALEESYFSFLKKSGR